MHRVFPLFTLIVPFLSAACTLRLVVAPCKVMASKNAALVVEQEKRLGERVHCRL
jgi:hypothetical protein